MAITAVCPHCGQSHQLDNALAGKKGRCTACKQTFRISAAQEKPVRQPVAPAAKKPAITTPYREQIVKHLDKRIGPSSHVFHEKLSDDIRLDLHIIPPTNEKSSAKHPLGTRHFTIVTSGLSATPMNVPAGAEASPYAELMIALPKRWPGLNPDGTIDKDVIRDPRNYWPFRWLKTIARMPHEQGICIAAGQPIPNGERAEPFAANTRLGCMLVFPSTLSHRATYLKIDDQITIHFLALYPLYPEEMKLMLQQGIDPLLEKFAQAEMTELIQPDRGSMCI